MTDFKSGDRVIGKSTSSKDYAISDISGPASVKKGVVGTVVEKCEPSEAVRVKYDVAVDFCDFAYYLPHELLLVEKENSLFNQGLEDSQIKNMQDAFSDPYHPYHSLVCAFVRAFEEATQGKGKERHANDLPFDEQQMQKHSDAIQNTGGMCFQVQKKCVESMRLDREAAVREISGAINYAAGMMVWRQRHQL